ncbi:hypothetical protein FRB90_008686 [Tulasnella sp. 427]|nr:hypothetical protein FRB90_008686 [Tulasnella sp. 427]
MPISLEAATTRCDQLYTAVQWEVSEVQTLRAEFMKAAQDAGSSIDKALSAKGISTPQQLWDQVVAGQQEGVRKQVEEYLQGIRPVQDMVDKIKSYITDDFSYKADYALLRKLHDFLGAMIILEKSDASGLRSAGDFYRFGISSLDPGRIEDAVSTRIEKLMSSGALSQESGAKELKIIREFLGRASGVPSEGPGASLSTAGIGWFFVVDGLHYLVSTLTSKIQEGKEIDKRIELIKYLAAVRLFIRMARRKGSKLSGGPSLISLVADAYGADNQVALERTLDKFTVVTGSANDVTIETTYDELSRLDQTMNAPRDANPSLSEMRDIGDKAVPK